MTFFSLAPYGRTDTVNYRNSVASLLENYAIMFLVLHRHSYLTKYINFLLVSKKNTRSGMVFILDGCSFHVAHV